LLWRVLISTSLAVTAVFAFTGWMVQRYAANVSEHSLEEEIRTSLQAYQSLWSARVHNLISISKVFSSMSDVRSAFMTRDRATIRDTAAQLWSQVSDQDASFLVLDPTGEVIASLGGDPGFSIAVPQMRAVLAQFPRQVYGYARRGSRLYYFVFTPVYVQAGTDQGLLNVLLVAFDIDKRLALALKQSTNGSDFAFVSCGDVIAATLPLVNAADLSSRKDTQNRARRVKIHRSDYLLVGTDLKDVSGNVTGELYIIRSFAGPKQVLWELQRNVGLFWGMAIVLALSLTYISSRRVLEPVKRLDRAAEEVARRNYDYRVPVETDDELGRLALTFNSMCDSIQRAREDLIHQERIATIGRLASSIVHDLRNPLAAIYGGAEMLVDADLSPEQQQRLAGNIYSASRRIQELLQELLDVSRSQKTPLETFNLRDICKSVQEESQRTAALRDVLIEIEIPEHIEVKGARDRLERVFLNLINNASDAMPEGGSIRITAGETDGNITISVEDTGPGIPEEAWAKLFQPFASFRKKNGLGLGLALSRQTLLEHGGDLWAEKTTAGARFIMRLPSGACFQDRYKTDQFVTAEPK